MGIALSEEAKKLVDGPNFAHLATIIMDPPHSVPVCTGREGDLLLVRKEFQNLACVLAPTFWVFNEGQKSSGKV